MDAHGIARIHTVAKPRDVFVGGLEGDSEHGGGGFGRMVQLLHDGALPLLSPCHGCVTQKAFGWGVF